MSGLQWLTSRPIAHRGLHESGAGIIENTPSAVSAAVARGYGIEVDLQITADGEAMVHHDDALGRLTEGQGALAAMTANQLRQVPFKATSDRMMSLGDLCALVDGRVTLVLELKSRFDGDRRVAGRTIDVLRGYRGPVAAMSFDPDLVYALRERAPELPRGIIAQRHFRHDEWPGLNGWQRLSLAWLVHAPRTRPDFIAYSVKDLPAAVPIVARRLFGRPLLTWTVRTEQDRAKAAAWADQIIFEQPTRDP